MGEDGNRWAQFEEPGIVTFDLDSTLADTRQRWHLYAGADTDWEAYSEACLEDDLMSSTAALLRMLARDHAVWIVSGRTESARGLTEKWLARQGLFPNGMILADSTYGTYADHAEYKLAMIKRVEEETGCRVVMHFDDYQEVGMRLREAGYRCVVIDPMYHPRQKVGGA